MKHQRNAPPAPEPSGRAIMVHPPKGLPVPGFSGRAQEILSNMDRAEKAMSRMRSTLFGEGEPQPSQPEPNSLEGMLHFASDRTAELAAQLEDIAARLAD